MGRRPIQFGIGFGFWTSKEGSILRPSPCQPPRGITIGRRSAAEEHAARAGPIADVTASSHSEQHCFRPQPQMAILASSVRGIIASCRRCGQQHHAVSRHSRNRCRPSLRLSLGTSAELKSASAFDGTPKRGGSSPQILMEIAAYTSIDDMIFPRISNFPNIRFHPFRMSSYY